MQMYGNKFKRTKQSFIFFAINLQLVINIGTTKLYCYQTTPKETVL